MGWNTGLDLADRVWSRVEKHLPENKKAEIAQSLITLFEGYDCDSMMESVLWEIANKECSCPNEDSEPNPNCQDCHGRGWVSK